MDKWEEEVVATGKLREKGVGGCEKDRDVRKLESIRLTSSLKSKKAICLSLLPSTEDGGATPGRRYARKRREKVAAPEAPGLGWSAFRRIAGTTSSGVPSLG